MKREKKTIIKRALALILAVTLFGGGYLLRVVTSKTKNAGATVSSHVITVTSGNASQSISASGTIEPTTQINVSFATTGTVNKVFVTQGQGVQSGQKLATLNTPSLSETVAQAQAALSGIEAKLANDQAANALSAQINADDASITAAQDVLATAQSNLSSATLTAPVTGIISAINLSQGQNVSTQSSSASPAFTIISANSWLVNASVSDVDIGQIQVGEQVTITPQGTTSVGYGTVTSVGLVASASGGVATFPVAINVTGSPAGFYAGVPAQVAITTKVIPNSTLIPLLAIYGGSSAPYVRLVTASGSIKHQPVTLGAVSGVDVAIQSGIKPGDKIEVRAPRFGGLAAGGARTRLGGGGLGGGGFGGGGLGG